ncbi:Six-hairpin glycosidase-like protein, partial [Dactylonectria macrodidyma]
SIYHLVSYDAHDGSVRDNLTCQGYENESTWARGQAWALYGFASVYGFTKDVVFLEAGCRLADYFLSRVDERGTDAGVVYWDFDAPRPGVWDASAACCASAPLRA